MIVKLHKRLARDLIDAASAGLPLTQTFEKITRPVVLMQLAAVAAVAAAGEESKRRAEEFAGDDAPRDERFAEAMGDPLADVCRVVRLAAQAAVLDSETAAAAAETHPQGVQLAARLARYQLALDNREPIEPETVGRWTAGELTALAAAALACYARRTTPDDGDVPGNDALAQAVADATVALRAAVQVVSLFALPQPFADAFGEVIETDVALADDGQLDLTPVAGWPPREPRETITSECATPAVVAHVSPAKARELLAMLGPAACFVDPNTIRGLRAVAQRDQPNAPPIP